MSDDENYEKNFCANVYLNGETLYTWRDSLYFHYWEKWVKQTCPASSIFINGEHVAGTGFLNEQEIKIAAALLTEYRNANIDSINIQDFPRTTHGSEERMTLKLR